jgi:hypothetical protein
MAQFLNTMALPQVIAPAVVRQVSIFGTWRTPASPRNCWTASMT